MPCHAMSGTPGPDYRKCVALTLKLIVSRASAEHVVGQTDQKFDDALTGVGW